MRVCVDEIETGFAELVHSMKEILRRNSTTCKCTFCSNEKVRKAELKEGKVNNIVRNALCLLLL
jgi:hypothetical protein